MADRWPSGEMQLVVERPDDLMGHDLAGLRIAKRPIERRLDVTDEGADRPRSAKQRTRQGRAHRAAGRDRRERRGERAPVLNEPGEAAGAVCARGAAGMRVPNRAVGRAFGNGRGAEHALGTIDQ